MHSTTVYNGMSIMVLVWRKSVLFWPRYARKTIFCILFTSDLDLALTFRPQIYSPSFSLSSGMLKCLRLSCLEKIGGTGQTGGQRDGVQHLMRPPGVGRITIEWIWTYRLYCRCPPTWIWWAADTRGPATRCFVGQSPVSCWSAV